MLDLSLFDSTRQPATIFRTLVSMLGDMRDADGRPKGRTRLIALLAAIGLLAMSAPILIPIVQWISNQIW
jgi:hypothetical protein